MVFLQLFFVLVVVSVQRSGCSSGGSLGFGCRNNNKGNNNDPGVAPETPNTLRHNSLRVSASVLESRPAGRWRKQPWPTRLLPLIFPRRAHEPNDPEPSPEVATLHTFIKTGTVPLMATGRGTDCSPCHLRTEGLKFWVFFALIPENLFSLTQPEWIFQLVWSV